MNLELLRSFSAIAELGSLNRAAEKLRVSQSTLTRQMQSLEQELGGQVLERSSHGVSLTAAGHRLREGMIPVIKQFEGVWREAQGLARGQSERLRIGYVMSAAAEFLHPALVALRRVHPEVKVKLFDLSPGQQAEALRNGELDVGLVALSGPSLAREFYTRKLVSLPVRVAVSEDHRLAQKATVRLADLKNEQFVGAREEDMPGHNRWIAQVCRKAGFRAAFLHDAESLGDGLATVVAERAVSLMPDYIARSGSAGVVFVPLREPAVTWDLHAVWQRGKVSSPVRALVDAFPSSSAKRS